MLSQQQEWLTSDFTTAPVQSAGHNYTRRAQGVDARAIHPRAGRAK